jgi:hypothetical protein
MSVKPFKLVTGMTVMIMLLVSACGIVPIFGSGNLVTETPQVSSFEAVAISGVGDLIVIQDGTESVTVETDDNLMQYLVTDVRDGTLELRLERKGVDNFRPTRLVFTVHIKKLTGVTASGTWNFTAEKINTDNLSIVGSGTGRVDICTLIADTLTVTLSGTTAMYATGQVTSQSITISGTGAYRTADLRSKTADVLVSGTGDAVLWATNFLTVSIQDAATVQYYGNPQTNIDTHGASSIQQQGDK